MADASVLVLEPTVGTATGEVDAESLGVGPNGLPLRRERMQLGGSALAEISRVLNVAPGGGEYGLITRNIPSGTQPVSLAAQVDVSDRDARLAGRSKILDSLGNVIDLALKAQLPAALVGARLDVNLGASGITLVTDPSDKDARLLGRVKLLDSAGAVIDPALKGQFPAALVGGRLSVDASGVAVPVTDNGGSLTVDAPVGTPAFVRLSDGAAALIGQKAMAASLPVTMASDQLQFKVTIHDFPNQAGQKNMGVSFPVVLASDQSAIPVTTVIPGTAAANLGKAEDAVAGDGDTGVFVLGVRNDTPAAAKTSADGDYGQVSVDRAGVLWVRNRQLITYDAIYRLADATAGELACTFTFTANANKQLATIYHTAASTKTVRIRRISLMVGTGALGVFGFEVRALSATTAPATGNPAITPRVHDSLDGAVEATCLALPTTAGSLVGVDTGTVGVPFSWNAAAAAAKAEPSGLIGQELVLYEYRDNTEEKPLIMRAGTAEGFAVNGRCTTAVALRFFVSIRFTEEA